MASPKRGSVLLRLLTLARPERAWLLWGTFFLLIGSVAGLAFPQGMRMVVDTALDKMGDGQLGALDQIILLLLAIAIVQGIAIGLRFYFFNQAGEKVVARLRKQLYAALLDQEIAFFDGARTGELTNRLASDTSVLQSAVSSNISLGLRNLVQGVGGIVLLLYTSPLLAVLMLAVVPAIAVGAVVYGRRVRKLAKQVQDSLAESSALAEESLSGIRTVRAFAAETREGGRYDASIDHAFGLATKRSRASATFLVIVTFAGNAAAAVVFWYGARLVVAKQLTVGQLTAFLVYTLIVGFSLGALADLWAEFMKAAGSAERIFELLDRHPSIAPRGGATLPSVTGRLELRDVVFAYPSRPDVTVLDHFQLVVAPSEVVALVGPSGAGKSTIAALLQRFYDPLAGTMLLDGASLQTLDGSWLRRQIGTVSQEPILFSTTIAENIRYGRPDATDAEVEEAARQANAEVFIKGFPDGYQTVVGERGVQLSGGQKQRVAIARALLKDPRILILDEATSALDAESEHLVKQALERLMQGRTTILIAHRLSTVKDADRVVVIDQGRVVQTGKHDTLLREDGLYRRLVERQFVAA